MWPSRFSRKVTEAYGRLRKDNFIDQPDGGQWKVRAAMVRERKWRVRERVVEGGGA